MAFSFKNICIRVTKLWQVFLFSLLKKVQKFVVYVICDANVEQSVTINMPTNSGFRCEMMWSITGDYQYQERILLWIQEEFEDTKGAIRIRISKKNRQHNGQKKKHKWSITDIYQYKDIFCRNINHFYFINKSGLVLCVLF
jgi:peptidyl-tRNA hydrolase